MSNDYDKDQQHFEHVIEALEAEIAAVGAHMVIDAAARVAYSRQILLMSDQLRFDVKSGVLTWKQAAEQAQDTRNVVMEVLRSRSTPVGRAMAESIKSQGKTLNELVARKTIQLYGQNAKFNHLPIAQQEAVYAEIVKSAGKSNPRVNALMNKTKFAGRGLIVLSLAISVYTVATAEDKVEAAGREAAITGGGIGGGIGGGAVAGLVCGPGAPVCVTVGAFIGGALGAFGVSLFW